MTRPSQAAVYIENFLLWEEKEKFQISYQSIVPTSSTRAFAGFTEEQAKAQVEVIANVFEQREIVYRQRLATKEDIEEVKKEIKDSTISLIKWFVPLLIAQGGLIVALIKFFV